MTFRAPANAFDHVTADLFSPCAACPYVFACARRAPITAPADQAQTVHCAALNANVQILDLESACV